ncbi:MAG: NUDIX domain-containing protein [Nanoarchaeota archaeon]|nr:NUDIX domain-containing protein [Nanoarchaeota archaeon]
MSDETKRPKVGLAVIIMKENEVLIGQRTKNIPGSGLWAFPGGHLEYRETWVEGSLREVREEVGNQIQIKMIDTIFPFAVPIVMVDKTMHYSTAFMRAKYIGGKISNAEPERCNGWKWCLWNNLPQPLFGGIQTLIDYNRNPIEENLKK